MRPRTAACVGILVSLLLAGCEATQEQRAGTGALVGAGVGAAAGQLMGGNTRSTVAGAGAGALIGAVAGTASTPPSTEYCRFRRPDGTIYTARC
jgi:hypothetical protein